MGKQNNFTCYGVARGRNPGVYDEYADCLAQTSGFPGAMFRGFHSRAEAETFVARNKATVFRSQSVATTPTGNANATASEANATAPPPVQVMCHCRKAAVRRTSHTTKNPNRAFFSCEQHGCKFFQWEDAVPAQPAAETAVSQTVTATPADNATNDANATATPHSATSAPHYTREKRPHEEETTTTPTPAQPEVNASAPPLPPVLPVPNVQVMCKCRKTAARRTSHTTKNPNRVFYGCEQKRCNFFQWEDAVLAEVAVENAIKEGASSSSSGTTKSVELQLRLGVTGAKRPLVLCFNVVFVNEKKEEGEGEREEEEEIEVAVAATLTVPYDKTLVCIIKKLCPNHRSWVPDKKHWNVHPLGIPQLLTILDDDEDVTAVAVVTGEGAATKTASKKRKKEVVVKAEDDEGKYERVLKMCARAREFVPPPPPSPAQHVKSEPTTSSSWTSEALASTAVASSSPIVWPQVKTESKFDCSLDSKLMLKIEQQQQEHKFDSRRHDAASREPPRPKRLWGEFKCNSCRHRWNSAYVWELPNGTVEHQQCRRCDCDNLPYETRDLLKGAGKGGDGAHEAALCGMCKKLGYPCNNQIQWGRRGSKWKTEDFLFE